MGKEIRNLVINAGMIELDKLLPFQPDNLKIMTAESFQRLKASIIENDFVTGFYVWKEGDKHWIIDGHHRKYALEELKKEGAILPEKYACLFLDIKDRKHAGKVLLTNASNHAKVHPEGFMEYIHEIGMDFKTAKNTLEIPGIDIDKIDGDIDDVEDESIEDKNKHLVVIDCKEEAVQQKLYEELKTRGYECKLMM